MTGEPRLTDLVGRLERLVRRRLSAAVEPSGLTLPAYTPLSVLRVHTQVLFATHF